MIPSFILDENIVILAQQGLDEYGNANPECADLMQQIIEICHTLVVDDVLWDKYEEQLYRPGYHHPTLGPFLIRALYNALTVSEKVDGLWSHRADHGRRRVDSRRQPRRRLSCQAGSGNGGYLGNC